MKFFSFFFADYFPLLFIMCLLGNLIYFFIAQINAIIKTFLNSILICHEMLEELVEQSTTYKQKEKRPKQDLE